MKPALFIADLHLDARRPAMLEAFARFIADEATQACALYILGDLFEAWIGDDADDEVARVAADALAGLHAAGVACFYLHGNRDFLLGDAYARRARMTLLPDPSLVVLGGERVLLMHGDLLCTDDLPYQAFRTQSRTPAWQRAFLARPLAERRAFAEQARAESRRYTGAVGDAITDVNAEAVRAALDEAGVRRLIHGHTHRPAVHCFEHGGRACERIVLGDWYEHAHRLAVWPEGRLEH